MARRKIYSEEPLTPIPRYTRRGITARGGKRPLQTAISPESHYELRLLALEKDTTMQNLVVEGLNLVMRKYGKPPVITYGERMVYNRGYSKEG